MAVSVTIYGDPTKGRLPHIALTNYFATSLMTAEDTFRDLYNDCAFMRLALGLLYLRADFSEQ